MDDEQHRKILDTAIRLGDDLSLRAIRSANEARKLRGIIWRALRFLRQGKVEQARLMLEQKVIVINSFREARLSKEQLVDIEGELRAETEKAYQLFDGSTTAWVPKAQVEYNVDDAVFTMPEWLAKEKGFI